MNVAILYERFFDPTGERILVGGIESYLFQLAKLAAHLGFKPIIFQKAALAFERTVEGIAVVGIPMTRSRLTERNRILFRAASTRIDERKDLIIFGADYCSVTAPKQRTLLIQHGVSWDLPLAYLTRKRFLLKGWGAWIKKAQLNFQAIRSFDRCPYRVCVDHNFPNWYRAISGHAPEGKVWVIPNFSARIADEAQLQARRWSDDPVRILFARRFHGYRGTRLLADAIPFLMKKNANLRFTFAGEGPDESWLRERFRGEPRVTFIRFSAVESLDVHLAHEIAVIPSLASEGTSLSVVEAMAAGCVVVASAVGGIPQMILHGFNGILANPTSADFVFWIGRLARDREMMRMLAGNAHQAARASFSLGRWRDQWAQVFSEINNS